MNDTSKKILIVENDRALSTALRDTMATKGYDVQVAASGETGLEIAKRDEPDLIILDLMLEQLTGIDVLREIRKDKQWGKEVKIIVLTGLTYLDNMEEVKKLSTKFLSKSDFEMNSLVDLVEQVLT